MDIKEVKEKRIKLAGNMAKLLNDFYAETECEIKVEELKINSSRDDLRKPYYHVTNIKLII